EPDRVISEKIGLDAGSWVARSSDVGARGTDLSSPASKRAPARQSGALELRHLRPDGHEPQQYGAYVDYSFSEADGLVLWGAVRHHWLCQCNEREPSSAVQVQHGVVGLHFLGDGRLDAHGHHEHPVLVRSPH